jgi:hypothetical protein
MEDNPKPMEKDKKVFFHPHWLIFKPMKVSRFPVVTVVF